MKTIYYLICSIPAQVSTLQKLTTAEVTPKQVTKLYRGLFSIIATLLPSTSIFGQFTYPLGTTEVSTKAMTTDIININSGIVLKKDIHTNNNINFEFINIERDLSVTLDGDTFGIDYL